MIRRHRYCIKCKYTDCVEVCPVDMFLQGENMRSSTGRVHRLRGLRPECPADAIKRIPGRSGKVAGGQCEYAQDLAKYHAEKGPACGAKEFDGQEGSSKSISRQIRAAATSCPVSKS